MRNKESSVTPVPKVAASYVGLSFEPLNVCEVLMFIKNISGLALWLFAVAYTHVTVNHNVVFGYGSYITFFRKKASSHWELSATSQISRVAGIYRICH
jgi:hypothetical protein